MAHRDAGRFGARANAYRLLSRGRTNVHPDWDVRASLRAFENAANVPVSTSLSTRRWIRYVHGNGFGGL